MIYSHHRGYARNHRSWSFGISDVEESPRSATTARRGQVFPNYRGPPIQLDRTPIRCILCIPYSHGTFSRPFTPTAVANPQSTSLVNGAKDNSPDRNQHFPPFGNTPIFHHHKHPTPTTTTMPPLFNQPTSKNTHDPHKHFNKTKTKKNQGKKTTITTTIILLLSRIVKITLGTH